MKKLILPIITLLLLFGTVSFAQEIELPNPGLTPDSPFYFLKSWKEKIQLFFAFGAENKAKQYLHLSEVRLAEYQKMIEKGKTEIAQKTLEKYEKQLNQALKKADETKDKGKDIEELAILITEKALKHQEVLVEVFEKVPEEAKKGIEKAIEVSRKGSEEAVQAVTGAKKEELQQKIKTIDWQIFIDSKAGYTIKYPSGWRRVDFENGIGVGPQEIREDILWGLRFYDSSQMSEDEIISKIGSQFELGRNVIRENIKFNNIQALKVIATTSQFPDWYSESIIIEHGGKLFHIGNGAIKDDKFEFFYKSFKFVELKEAVEEIPELKKDCEEITNRFEKGRCYFNLATETKDSSLCKKTTDEAACYQNIAIATKDVSLCEKITNNIHKTTCYAIVKNDSGICEEITDSFGKQICYKNFEERTKTEDEEVEKPKVEKPEDETHVQKKDVAAIVNGAEITNDEFIQKLKVYLQSNKSQLREIDVEQKVDETEDEFIQRLMPFSKGVLEQMITEIIITQKAEEQNITASPEEIDEKLDELKPTAQKLSEMGMTIEELRQQVELQILLEKIVAKGVIVTEKEIRDYFESHKANFAKPEEIKASHILFRTEIEAKVVLSQLKAGADFAELARRESADPITKDKGGDLGFFSRGKMTPAFEEAAFVLEAGEISEVVKTPYGYHIIKVLEKKSAQEPNLELAREEISQTLTQQKTWTKQSTLLQDLKKEAEIEIRLPELRD